MQRQIVCFVCGADRKPLQSVRKLAMIRSGAWILELIFELKQEVAEVVGIDKVVQRRYAFG